MMNIRNGDFNIMDLNDFRNNIDEIDDKIVKLLLERFAVAENIAEYKKQHNLEIFQKGREAEVLKKIAYKTNGINNGEYKDYILKIYSGIIDASKSFQYTII